MASRSPRRDRLMMGEDDDGNDDDDDLIMYGDQSVPDPLTMSQPGMSHTQTQSSTPSLPPFTRGIPRHERRKRRHEWRERQLAEQQEEETTYPSPEDDDDDKEQHHQRQEASDNPMEDAFAGLQSLLNSHPSQSQSQDCGDKENSQVKLQKEEKEPTQTVAKRTSIPVEKSVATSTQQHCREHNLSEPDREKVKPQQPSHHAGPMESSPSDFVVYNAHDQEDEDTTHAKRPKKKQLQRDSASRDHKRRRSDNMKQIRSQLRGRAMSEPEFATPAASPVRPKKRRSSLQRFHSVDPSVTQSQPQPATQVQQSKKSIVGTRPMHWNRNRVPKSIMAPMSQQRQRGQRLAKAAALAAATRKPLKSRLSPPKVPQPSKELVPNNSGPAIGPARNMADVVEKNPRSSISFAPSFMPFMPSSFRDQVEEGRQSIHKGLSPLTKSPATAFSPPLARRRRNSKANNGKWTKRHQVLRSARSNDALRLQNQAFSRHSAFDLNDPRKKARSHSDLTILGDCSGPWVNATEDAKVTVLGFLHRHTPTGCATSTHQDEPAWVSFTIATARSIGLQNGIQLRLYNAVVIPCRVPSTIEASMLQAFKRKECRYAIVCTHLCESYPSDLEPLPDIGL